MAKTRKKPVAAKTKARRRKAGAVSAPALRKVKRELAAVYAPPAESASLLPAHSYP